MKAEKLNESWRGKVTKKSFVERMTHTQAKYASAKGMIQIKSRCYHSIKR